MHQELLGVGDVDQRVAAGGDLAQARAQHDQQIRILDGGGELGIQADFGRADIAAVAVVEVVLVAEGRRDRQVEALGEGLHRLLRGHAPAGAADDHERTCGLGELVLQLGQILGAGVRFRYAGGLGVGCLPSGRLRIAPI